jgi:hypothetical protein
MNDNKILTFLNEITETMSYLYGRWQDEKEYEDINDYQKPLKSLLEKHNVTIVKMTKRPFGFRMIMEGKSWDVKTIVRGYNLCVRATETV